MTEPFRDDLPSTCDILVVGAGPAGLAAAIAAVQAGAKSVVLLDGRDPWREPVACAEGVREAAFLRWSPIDAVKWKRGAITGCIFGTVGASFAWYSPQNAGWILDRAGFHAGMAARCRELGVVCHFRTRVKSVELAVREGGYRVDLGEATVRARRVIDASGPGSAIGREQGFAQGKDDLETAAFALVAGLEHPEHAIQLWMHPSYSPGGYAWIFPRGDGVANVGVVVGRGAAISSRQGLGVFLESLRPGITEGLAIRGGAIPNGCGNGRIAFGGLFKAGDAAGMVNALSRGGIVEGLCAGSLAGKHAAASLLLPEGAGIEERAYQKAWKREFGAKQRWVMRAKPWINRISPEVMRRTFATLAKAPNGYIEWSTAVRVLAWSTFKVWFRF